MSLRHSITSRSTPIAGALLGSVLAATIMPVVAHAEEAVDTEAQSRTIVVTGHREADANPNANENAPFKVEKSADGKFTEPLRDTPRTVTAIPKEVLEDIGATSFRDVVRATPGVTIGTGEGGNAFGDRIFIRGFEARNDVYIDGLRDPGVTSREIFAVEQIEIVKGPSGSFGGRGTTGGLVSLQSKRPMFNDFAVLEASAGTENFYRGTMDVNATLSDKFAIRINNVYQNSDTPGRDHVKSERYGTAIALRFQASEAFAISADYYRARLDGIPDFGHPFDTVTQQPYKVDRDNFYGVIGRDFLRNGADIGTLRLDLSDGPVTVRSLTRYGKTYNRYIVGTPGAVCRRARTAAGACPTAGAEVPEDQYTITAGGQRRWGDNDYIAHLTDATVRFDTWGVGHTLVAGAEYSRESVETLPLTVTPFVEDANGNVISTSLFVRNLLAPNSVLDYRIPVGPDRTNGPTTAKVKSLSTYLIDTIKFTPQLSLTAGARFDTYDLEFFNPDSSTAAGLQPLRLNNNAEFLNWQASLVYKPAEEATLYASFSTSSNPSGEQLDGNGIAYDGIAPQTANLDPERNRSWEAGAKYELFDGELLLSAAAFQITKSNARENIGGNVYELVGKLRSRGFELGVSGNIGPRIQVFGGYTYTNAKIIDSVTVANIGRRFANIPRHSASLLATYSVTDHFEIGGQVYYQDKLFGGTLAAGTAHVPGYARFDAVARWEPIKGYQLRLNVLNLTDKTYYDAIYRSGTPFAYVAPGRSATLSLTASF